MACPFFMPVERLDDGSWPHPARLPLGCGWQGHCTAPGHGGEVPSPEELREFCNLGYAENCSRIPPDRAWDAVRFSLIAPNPGAIENCPNSVYLRFVCERGHRPAEHGLLEFNVAESRWAEPHPDCRVQQMAECFFAEHWGRKKRQEAGPAS